MPYKYKVLLTLTPLVLLLDQFTKWLILRYFQIGEILPIVPGFFDLVHVRNNGAAFGLFANLPDGFRGPFFYLVSFAAVIALIYFFKTLPQQDRYHPWPLSLISAGVFGNLADRVRFGNVVDFLSFHVSDQSLWGIELQWPAFNIADSAITISMFLLLFPILKRK